MGRAADDKGTADAELCAPVDVAGVGQGGCRRCARRQLVASFCLVAVSAGYVMAAVLMLIAAGEEAKLGTDAEGKSLEGVAEPLSSSS